MIATMHAYNLFKHRDETTFFCAVPEDRVVPPFVSASAWAFSRKLETGTTVPVGFNRRAAVMGVRFNGFYLYQTLPR